MSDKDLRVKVDQDTVTKLLKLLVDQENEIELLTRQRDHALIRVDAALSKIRELERGLF